ncbi:MAG: N-acetyl-gamma-glutamyl-phosphate reductase, partial [Candidatus Dadabacteria bacterium]
MNEKRTRIAIVGANGYTGGELLRLLAAHPNVTVTAATSRSQAGQPLDAVFPALTGVDHLPAVFADLDASAVAEQADVVMTCLPHGDAQDWVARLIPAGRIVIDLSADYRYREAAIYEKAYQPHKHPDLAARAVYGLPEWQRDQIREADLIANPGCYPTSVLLPLIPVARASLIEPDIIVDSQSGVSGAGRTPKANLLHGEVSETLQAYGLPLHRHQSEMRWQLSDIGGFDTRLTFTPHLAPVNRGILSTIHVRPVEGVSSSDIRAAIASAYADSPFIHLLPDGRAPRTDAVRGSNSVHLQVWP